MSAKANYFKIGLFVILAVVLGVVSVIILGADVLFQEYTTVETYFDDSVQGIDIGSKVKFRGVAIGDVSGIFFATDAYDTARQYVVVRMSLTGGPWDRAHLSEILAAEQKKGLRIRLTPQGVTGASYLELDYEAFPEKALSFEWKPDYPYIASTPSVITQIGDSLTSIMKNLEAINVPGLVSTLELTLQTATKTLESTNVANISEEAKGLLVEIRATNQHLDELITGLDFQALLDQASGAASETIGMIAETRGVVAEAKGVVAEAKGTVASARRIMERTEGPWANFMVSLQDTSASASRLGRNLDSFTGQLPATLDQLQVVLRRLDQVLTIPQAELESTMENLRITSENLRELTENTRKYPAQIIFGEPPRPVNRER